MDDADATLAQGQELLAQGQPAKALAVFDALLQSNPHDIEAQVGRVAALLHMGEPQLALGACDKVLATQPTHLNALVLKCWVLMSLRRYDDVREILNQYLWNERDSALFWHIDGKLQLLRQELDLALDSLDMALGRDPDLCDAWIDKGNVLLRLGRPEDALLAFGRALALQPDNNEARKGRDRARAMQRSSNLSDLAERLPDLLMLVDMLGGIFH